MISLLRPVICTLPSASTTRPRSSVRNRPLTERSVNSKWIECQRKPSDSNCPLTITAKPPGLCSRAIKTAIMRTKAARSISANTKDPELIHDRREQLIRAALEVFQEKGFHITTVRDIGG